MRESLQKRREVTIPYLISRRKQKKLGREKYVYSSDWKIQLVLCRAVVDAQLIEQLLHMPWGQASNPVISDFSISYYLVLPECKLCGKDENKEKEAGNSSY